MIYYGVEEERLQKVERFAEAVVFGTIDSSQPLGENATTVFACVSSLAGLGLTNFDCKQ